MRDPWWQFLELDRKVNWTGLDHRIVDPVEVLVMAI